MVLGTGQTIYEQIVSVDADNNPITATTFDAVVYKNGSLYSAVTVDISLSDSTRGIFSAEWSADTIGFYQLYVKNNTNSVIFLSENVIIKTDDELSTNVYIGL